MTSMLDGGVQAVTTPSGNNPSGAAIAEIQRLRGNLARSQTSLKVLNSELSTLKTAKAALEAELESLSQALFEEANKMVSEERKKFHKHMEEIKVELRILREELDEVKMERDAVKRTMKFLEEEARLGVITPPVGGIDALTPKLEEERRLERSPLVQASVPPGEGEGEEKKGEEASFVETKKLEDPAKVEAESKEAGQ